MFDQNMPQLKLEKKAAKKIWIWDLITYDGLDSLKSATDEAICELL